MQRQLSEPAMLEEVDPAKAPTFDAVESEKALETAKKLTEIRKEKQAEVARAQVELDHAHRSLAQAIANEEEAVALAVMVMLA